MTIHHGYSSVIRWADNPVRDEWRNLGIILVAEDGAFAEIRTLPANRLPGHLRKSGILAAVLAGFRRQFRGEQRANRTRAWLEAEWRGHIHSLQLTEPRPCAVSDPAATIEALYMALVRPRPPKAAAE